MALTPHQNRLLSDLRQMAQKKGTRTIVYKSEWLGYLPYGQYHWVEVDGDAIDSAQPDSLASDLDALAASGILKLKKKLRRGKEPADIHIYYELAD